MSCKTVLFLSLAVFSLLFSFQESRGIGIADYHDRMIDSTKTWILIDKLSQTLYLMEESDTIWKAECGIGTGKVLRQGDKVWRFGTPSGERKVVAKIRNPVWRKPDWAFIEDGKLIPSSNDPSRIVRNHLGKYKLDLGDEVGIHGIRGARVYGRVSHGCIRLEDADLEIVWRNGMVGTKVVIR
jgi:L,D-transpeptidase ErfK/SrfK